MSDKHPECPLYNPLNCKEYFNPKLCAFTRKDRLCQKKRKPKTRFDEDAAGESDCGELANELINDLTPPAGMPSVGIGKDPEIS